MRRTWFIAGLIVLALAWLGPLPRLAPSAFWAHMTMHMAVVALAAPLLAVGLGGSRWDPADRYPGWFAPIPASLAELGVVWAWHAPGLHHFARHSSGGVVLEQGMFLLAGVWVWLSAFGGARPRSRCRTAAGLIGLLMTSMHMTLLGALLALSPRPLYDHAHQGPGLSALDDQHLGGAIMLLVGGVSYLAGGLWLAVDLVRAAPWRKEVGA